MIYLQSEEGWEEVFDYIFPEDESIKPNLKLLERAKAWKMKQQEENPESSQTSDAPKEV
jgi:crooked neck